MKNGYIEAQELIKKINADLDLDHTKDAEEIRALLRHDVLATMNYLRTIKTHCELLMDFTLQDRGV